MKKEQPVRKNDDISLVIDGYTSEGAGIGRYEGFAVFVPGALAGETVDVHIIKVASSYAIGKLISVKVPNEDIRALPVCPVFDKCGGCNLQHMSYQSQLAFKLHRVENALTRLGGVNVDIPPVIPCDNQFGYRNKASFPFGTIDGKVCLGFYAPRSHRLIPISECMIQKPAITASMRAAEQWANMHKISVYDEEKGDGILRHLVVRETAEGVLVCVVTSGSFLSYADNLTEMLAESLSASGIKLIGLIHNINPKATNVIFGSQFRLISGKATQSERICGLDFSLRTQSFLQVNHTQTEKLYEIALDYLGDCNGKTVFDIYCGVGTLSLLAAGKAGQVIGIEYVPEAVEDAQKNAVRNGIGNVSFLSGAAERILPELVEKGQRADAVILDPPRAGCDADVLYAIAKSGANRVVYVSCNPETLARDVKILSSYGFRAVKAQPVDMFPQTEHVETVVLMRKE